VVAGEHSGDEHAARMVAGLRARRPGVRVAALGGPRLAAAGRPAPPRPDGARRSSGLRRCSGTSPSSARSSRRRSGGSGNTGPSAVCFVDNSGVNLRLAEALRLRGISIKGGGTVRTLYYISPQIWASRAGRRFEMARNLDALAVIFPFEAECYADTGLPVEFVGHPFMAPDYSPPVRFDPAGPVLLLPGQPARRRGRIFPALLGGYREFAGRSRAGGRSSSIPARRSAPSWRPPAFPVMCASSRPGERRPPRAPC
jgi:lipid-A-disaccharide synthase